MSNLRSSSVRRHATYKQVDVGQKVVLNDQYMVENHRTLQLEAIVLETMENAEQAAHDLVEAARKEAQDILAAAREKAAQTEQKGISQRDATLKQAYDDGYQAGLSDGVMHVAQQMADQINLADTVLEKAFEAEQLLISKHQAHLAQLIRTVLQLILAYEIETKPEQIVGLVEKALQQFHMSGVTRLILHPATLQLMQQNAPAVVERMSEVNRLKFQLDNNCAPYQMYLETAEGTFDISPESQANVYLNTVETHLLAKTQPPAPVQKAPEEPELNEEPPEDPALDEMQMLEDEVNLVLEDPMGELYPERWQPSAEEPMPLNEEPAAEETAPEQPGDDDVAGP